MSDVEWYVESGGVRRGPFSARQILDQVKTGETSPDSLVTTPRMQGDWVTVQDLAEAYSELNQKKVAQPVNATASGPTYSGNFHAPPRPVEQLEASKLIVLQPESEGDATDSLFAAVQAIREKKQHRAFGQSRDTTGESPRSGTGSVLPKQIPMVVALLALLGIAAYGVTQFLKKQPETASSPSASSDQAQKNQTPSRPGSGGAIPPAGVPPEGSRLLSEGGAGTEPPPPRRFAPISRPRVESYRRDEPERPPEREREELPPEPASADSEHLNDGPPPEQPPDNETNPVPESQYPGPGGRLPDDPARQPVEEVAPLEGSN